MKNMINIIKNQKIITIIGILALIGLVLIIVAVTNRAPEQQISTHDPIDISVDFYKKWLEERKSPDTNPYESGLSKSLILSPELRDKLEGAREQSEETPDPVLCQTTTDFKFNTRIVYAGETETQVLVTAKDKTLTGQSVFTLLKHKDGWFIKDIKCNPGEFGEEREFSFEREGSLVKGSSISSFNPDLWYIIFDEDGRPVHNAPLLFSAESMCLNENGEGSVCVPDQFTEAMKVKVQGQMTEGGVEVKNLQSI